MSDAVDQPDYDEYRPAKKMKLDGALSTTMNLQEEIVDDDESWDDIYGDESAVTEQESSAQQQSAAKGVLPIAPPSIPDRPEEEHGQDITKKACEEQDDVFVDETPHHITGLDTASQKVLDETSTTRDSTLDVGALDVSTMPIPSNTGLVSSTATEQVSVDTSQPDVNTGLPQTEVQDEEFRFDSSDDDSSTDSQSSDSDDESDGDYPLLDAAAAAKILMAGDGDDEDGGDKKAKVGGDHQPRTANEVKEDAIPRPDISITPDMQITVLGKIEGIVENSVLIKGHTSGEYQVLEPGSVLCTHDRKVVGVVADLFGRVQQPMYSVLFNSQDDDLLQELQLTPGVEISYVNSHSKFVFTQPLRGLKGTDASNLHDEEVGEDELEFSDDEQEAEFKRQRKLAKKTGRGNLSRGAFNDGERVDARTYGAPNHDAGRSSVNYGPSSDAPSATYGGGMDYDDDNNADVFYQPLRRPDNLAEMMAGPAFRGNSDRGRGRGRGDRGRGRGDRGRGRGGQRGGRSRGSAPGAHNNDRATQHTKAEANVQPTGPPAAVPLQAYTPASAQQYAQPQQPSQTYQFNGYNFQYGNPPAQAQPQQSYAYYGVPQPGAHVNPAFYNAYQQQPQPQTAAYPQQYTQNGYTQPTAPVNAYTAAQQQDLAEVMRRLGQYSQQK